MNDNQPDKPRRTRHLVASVAIVFVVFIALYLTGFVAASKVGPGLRLQAPFHNRRTVPHCFSRVDALVRASFEMGSRSKWLCHGRTDRGQHGTVGGNAIHFSAETSLPLAVFALYKQGKEPGMARILLPPRCARQSRPTRSHDSHMVIGRRKDCTRNWRQCCSLLNAPDQPSST